MAPKRREAGVALQRSIDAASVKKEMKFGILSALKVWLVAEVETNRLEPRSWERVLSRHLLVAQTFSFQILCPNPLSRHC